MLCGDFKRILLLFQLIGLIAANHLNRQKRVVHGSETSIHKFPYQVSLRYADTSNHFCGGAILSNLWIVTAAQCTQDSKSSPENIYVMVGITNITQKGLRYDLAKIINHPEFNWAKRLNDISMLKVDRSMQLMEEGIFPVKLLSFNTNYYMENGIGLTTVILSGWGSFHVSFFIAILIKTSW